MSSCMFHIYFFRRSYIIIKFPEKSKAFLFICPCGNLFFLPLSLISKQLHPVIRTIFILIISYSKIPEILIQNICPMAVTVHPAVHHLFRRFLAPGNIFTAFPVRYPLLGIASNSSYCKGIGSILHAGMDTVSLSCGRSLHLQPACIGFPEIRSFPLKLRTSGQYFEKIRGFLLILSFYYV